MKNHWFCRPICNFCAKFQQAMVKVILSGRPEGGSLERRPNWSPAQIPLWVLFPGGWDLPWTWISRGLDLPWTCISLGLGSLGDLYITGA
jgi:hypothetical protein